MIFRRRINHTCKQ